MEVKTPRVFRGVLEINKKISEKGMKGGLMDFLVTCIVGGLAVILYSTAHWTEFGYLLSFVILAFIIHFLGGEKILSHDDDDELTLSYWVSLSIILPMFIYHKGGLDWHWYSKNFEPQIPTIGLFLLAELPLIGIILVNAGILIFKLTQPKGGG